VFFVDALPPAPYSRHSKRIKMADNSTGAGKISGRNHSWPTLSAFLSLLAAIGAAIAAWLSYEISVQSERQSEAVETRQSLETYLAAYRDAREKLKWDEISTWDGYKNAPPQDQAQIQIVLGLLVEAVDVMNSTHDDRAAMWASNIGVIKGPLAQCEFDPKAFAREAKTKEQIDMASKKARKESNVNCT
jgi:hypothetical protein